MKDKIDVLSFKPSVVTSNMTRGMRKTVMEISAEEAVRCALDKLSYETESHGCWKHIVLIKAFNLMMWLMPESRKYKVMRQ